MQKKGTIILERQNLILPNDFELSKLVFDEDSAIFISGESTEEIININIKYKTITETISIGTTNQGIIKIPNYVVSGEFYDAPEKIFRGIIRPVLEIKKTEDKIEIKKYKSELSFQIFNYRKTIFGLSIDLNEGVLETITSTKKEEFFYSLKDINLKKMPSGIEFAYFTKQLLT